MTRKPSDRRDEILAAIQESFHPKNRAPTLREIGKRVGISSTSHVNVYLDKLENDGRIRRDRGVARGIQLVEDHFVRGRLGGVVDIPLAGYIFASKQPVLVGDTPQTAADETVRVTRDLVRDTQGLFALRVKGDSMIDALVYDGDIVVLKQVDHANNGDMVAVWLRDRNETTLKHFYLEGSQVRLQPANPTLQPIFVDAAHVDIQGKVVAIWRQMP